MAISIRGHVLNDTQMDAIKGLIKKNAAKLMSKSVFERTAEAILLDAGCPLPMAAVRASPKSFNIEFVGGPWHGKVGTMKTQDANNPLSLPIHVGGYAGRYNMNTGTWVPMENQQ